MARRVHDHSLEERHLASEEWVVVHHRAQNSRADVEKTLEQQSSRSANP